MSTSSSPIEWTDRTWNPIRGCSRVSEGCRNCYAESIAGRFSDSGAPFEGFAKRTPMGARWTGKVALVPEKLAEPLSWRKPARVFVNSMSDLFHEGLSFEDIAAVFGVMGACPHLTFQILTKRPERAREFFAWTVEQGEELREAVGEEPPSGSPIPSALAMIAGGEDVLGLKAFRVALKASWPLPNVWLGVSVEDQPTADARLPEILACPAAVHFVSHEPALGPVDFGPYLPCCASESCDERAGGVFLDQVIVGGESGPGARPFDLGWMRSTVRQCREANVAVFCKQVGARPCDINGFEWKHHSIDHRERRLYGPKGYHAATSWSTGAWHTWNRQGVGGKNGYGKSQEMAENGAEAALVRQGWHELKLRDRKGGDMAEWPEDLRVRMFPGESWEGQG